MPKLSLKRTPAEEAQREYRKARKAARKSAKRSYRCSSTSFEDSEPGSSKRTKTDSTEHRYASDGEEVEYGPQPPPPAASSSEPDYEAIRAQLEEERFREKMFGAAEDDVGDYGARLDGLEAQFHGYTQTQVPSRHRGGMPDDLDYVNPAHLEDEEYVEWVRASMWKKKHADEHAEQLRVKAAKVARKAQKQALKEETSRLERAMEEERRKRRLAREGKKWDEAREAYECRWKTLLAGDNPESELRFEDLPWPIFSPPKSSNSTPALSLAEFTPDAITSFLVPTKYSILDTLGIQPQPDPEANKDARKKKLRETVLKYHPDKFEVRILGKVRASDRDRVKEAVGCVVRTVSDMMERG